MYDNMINILSYNQYMINIWHYMVDMMYTKDQDNNRIHNMHNDIIITVQ